MMMLFEVQVQGLPFKSEEIYYKVQRNMLAKKLQLTRW